MKKIIKHVLTNKIILYLSSRYITYILHFFVSMYIAAELGPSNYGVWSFLFLIYLYFNTIDLGIPHSVQVYLVQNKNDKTVSADYEKTGRTLMGILALSCLTVVLYYSLGGIKDDQELNVGWLLYGMCFCSFMNYFNNLYDRIYRSKNRLFELAFKQTSVVIIIAIAALFFHDEQLLAGLVISYILWSVLSFLVFSFRGGIDYSGHYSRQKASQIMKKGIFLFLFHASFSLIILSTRTLIKIYFPIEEFGIFSFAYVMGHALYNCILAFSTVTITKLLDRFHSSDRDVVISTVSVVRVNYVTLFHGVMYLAIMAFPFIISFMPKYTNALLPMNLCALMMLLYTNSYGYASFLIATNKEKKLAFLGISSLVINILLGLYLINVLHLSYEYVVLATMASYMYYSYLCAYYGRKNIGLSKSFITVLLDGFPLRLLIPFCIAVAVSIYGNQTWTVLPLLVFVMLNIKAIKSICRTIKKLIVNPNIVDI